MKILETQDVITAIETAIKTADRCAETRNGGERIAHLRIGDQLRTHLLYYKDLAAECDGGCYLSTVIFTLAELQDQLVNPEDWS